MDLTDPIFQDADKAREYLEAQRWPTGPYCPHCGEAEDLRALEGKSHRPGLYQCNACRKQFTVTVGTVFERSKVPLNKWLLATYLLSSSKKGMSAHQLHRTLGVTYKTAWFMAHRIREAMRNDGEPPMGGSGKHVEADETYIGRRKAKDGETFGKRGPSGKNAIVSLVERGGSVRSFHVESANKATVGKILRENVLNASTLHTDESNLYPVTGKRFTKHETVRHTAGEYVRGNAYTNTVEGYFSIFKRGMKGVYQHCGEKHLHRYLSEFDFRYSTRAMSDTERAALALVKSEGKRLTYRRPAVAI